MKFASPLLALVTAGPVCATITYVNDPAAGAYLVQQSFTYNSESITWKSGLPIGSGFFVQAFEDSGDVYLGFGRWNSAPFAVTSTPLSFGASVKSAPSFQNQVHLSSFGAVFANRYYGIRYDVGGGNFQYGWINFSTSLSGALVHGIAFNTLTEADIAAGQTSAIPEPGAYAACAAFAASASVLGRRRRKVAALA